jgi:hypothetical protein
MTKYLLPTALALLIAIGCGGERGHAKKAGQAVGETVTDFTRGVGSGIDKRLEVNVELSEKLTGLGVSKTVAKSAGIDDHKKGVTVYLMSQTPVTGSLVARALNDEGAEIGRSVVDIELGADDAKYVTFRFDPEMDSQLVERYLIDVKPDTDQPAKVDDSAPMPLSEQ